MAVDYKFRKGVDLPNWAWLAPFLPGPSYHGSASTYDGARYVYWAIQYGTTATTASTLQLWAFDTWTNGWQFLATLTSGNGGVDLEHDPVRNVLWIIHGAALTEWRYFNLNNAAVTLAGLTTNPWTLSAAIATVLPAAAGQGASLAMRNDVDTPAVCDSGTAATGSSTTSIVSPKATFTQGQVGLQLRFTSGTLAGQRRPITGVTSTTVLTVTRAFSAAPAAGDTWVIELPADTAVTGSTTTTLVTAGGMGTNAYATADVVITAGTGVGQRRRIASNDATTLTLAAAVTGATRTGPWTTTPDTTSVFQIVPSSDFLYYLSGGTTATFYRLDVTATTLAWSALTAAPATIGGGGNLLHPHASAPFRLIAPRGLATNTIYLYDPGPGTWATLNTAAFAGETFTAGAASCLMHGRRKLFLQKEGSQRCMTYDLVTGAVDPAPILPYAAPAGYDGKRARFVVTADGVEFLYLLRAGGQEFYRVPVEWL